MKVIRERKFTELVASIVNQNKWSIWYATLLPFAVDLSYSLLYSILYNKSTPKPMESEP